jgi:outer membrane protein assembly factor BamA
MFRHAQISTESPLSGDSVLAVQVTVLEGDMHRVRVGAGITTTDYVSAEGRWINRNFLGGRRLEVRGRLSNMVPEELASIPIVGGLVESCAGIYCDIAGSLNADFSQPWFFGPQNAIGAGLFLERFSLPGVYVRTSRGAYVSARRNFLGSGLLTGLYRPELTELESDGDLIFCVNIVACEEREIDVLRSPHWLAPVTASFTRDRSNSLFAPTRGYILRTEAEYAGLVTGSDYSHTRLVGEVSYYHDPFRGVVYATRLRVGWARAVGEPGVGLGLQPQKRFFAGGPNSVRGFAQYRLGPKLLTVDAVERLALPVDSGGAGCTAQQINAGSCDASVLDPDDMRVQPVGGAVLLEGNVEVRFPVWGDFLRGATFIDFGQVWRGEESVQLSQLQWTPGIGIRYFSPIGPIRIDVGYNPSGAERLTVVTTEVCDGSQDPCADIVDDVVYTRGDLQNRRQLRTLPAVTWKPFDSFRNRLQLHFSIGQAF